MWILPKRLGALQCGGLVRVAKLCNAQALLLEPCIVLLPAGRHAEGLQRGDGQNLNSSVAQRSGADTLYEIIGFRHALQHTRNAQPVRAVGPGLRCAESRKI